MEIVDVTYNFELFEDAALKIMKNFNDCVDKALEAKELWEGVSKCKSLENVAPWFKDFYKNHINDDGEVYNMAYDKAKVDIQKMVIDTLADLKLKTSRMQESFVVLISLMGSRVSYLEEKYSQDEIYGNYKLRTEVQDLKRKIKKYENIMLANLDIAKGYTLSSFGLEIDGEPDLE